MDNLIIQDLLNRYELGEATAEEKLMVELWYHQEASASEFHVDAAKKALVYLKLKKNLRIEIDPPVKKLKWYSYAAAASVLLALCISLYLINIPKAGNSNGIIVSKNDIAPGGSKAVLTLADGRQIILDQKQNGIVARQGESKINKTADGALSYNNQGKDVGTPMTNTLSIPRGGQYQVTLPDGTRAWLNSATTLTYPTAFVGKERVVRLLGEAYFEVSHNPQRPFIVKTATQEVRVLGTHFNISAYGDEEAAKTTLMEGSVKVSQARNEVKSEVLKPGQQSILTGNTIKVSQVDTEIAIDWKNGLFDFNEENLENLMKKISRWYDVEVVYEGNVAKTGFGGEVSRSKKLSEVLKVLETTGAVHFKVEGRRITVMK